MAATESKNISSSSSSSNNNKDWKQYWKDTELVPSTREDKQLPFLIETLKKELDIEKIETVLEVGVGYGRVAKGILESFPNIKKYIGMDISDNALAQSEDYLDEYHFYTYYTQEEDFEYIVKSGWYDIYDLVISVETMSVIPSNINACGWVDKMISLSKKYVVNLDYIETTNPITNNGHAYDTCYYLNRSVGVGVNRLQIVSTPNNKQRLFIARVK